MDIFSILNRIDTKEEPLCITSGDASSPKILSINQSISILQNKECINATDSGGFYDPTKSTLIESPESEYKKKWIKLDKHQKINRLMHYINNTNIIKENGIMFKQVQTLLVDFIMNKCIKNFNVNYNEIEGVILDVPDLKQNISTKLYYIGTDITEINIITKDYKNLPIPFKGINLGTLF